MSEYCTESPYRYNLDQHGRPFNEIAYRYSDVIVNTVGCPRCGQRATKPCRTPSGQITSHRLRHDAWVELRRVASACVAFGAAA